LTMHFPTPHITKKSEKRKKSVDSGVGDDDIVREEKITGTMSKKTKTKKAKVATNEDMNPSRPASPSPSPPRATSLSSSRKDSAQEPPPTTLAITSPTTADAQTQTPDTETPTLRRSSRIKNSMHVVADTWTKCRPYIERINGTIMPLEPQGTKAYYARDGVRVD